MPMNSEKRRNWSAMRSSYKLRVRPPAILTARENAPLLPFVAAIRAATGRELNRVPVRPDDIVFGTVARSGWAIVPGMDPRAAVRG